MRRIVSILFLVLGAGVCAAPPPFEFRDGDRVVFLGDTWVEREQTDGYIEARITSRLGGKKVIFRNLAWSADTVLGESRAAFDPPEKGFDRLKEELQAIKPTVALLGYGMAESFKGEAGLEQFKADMKKLMDTIEEISKPAAVRFIIVTPPFHEKLPPPLPDPAAHNEQLRRYSEALIEIAAARKATVIDLFATLERYHRPGNVEPFTDNGIHPTPFGYWNIATAIERGLGLYPGAPRVGLGANGSLRTGSAGFKPANIVQTSTTVTYTAEEEFMVFAPRPKATPEDQTPPPGFLLQLLTLTPGTYTMRIDGEPAAVYTDEEWKRGAHIQHGPAFAQAEELRRAVVQKNQLFFYRWRPQNQTYLFGFRKYEQGQNAREIPMFDPLIAEQESKIRELTALKTRNYALAPAEPGDKVKLAGTAPKKEKRAIDLTPLPHPQFTTDPNLEVTLFAENPDLAKPIHMNFDAQGRLWVASSAVYPQIMPGQAADDKILILEDTDNDGKADKSTVFADSLLIPTGIEPGDGGAYVANSTELLFFKDVDGDGRADHKRIMLAGFGTEDTHHILHTLRWGHDGQLYMNQSIYIHSHIETPHGVVRLDSGGILNLRPPSQELGIHMKGLINSWGHHFDRFGQSFATDGAGGEGINWVVPQAMYVTYEGARRVLHGVSPGSYPKFCGLEVVESEHFPNDWQGNMVTCDFRAHRVVRFSINDQGAGYVTKEMPDLMRTTNVTFRPIDVKLGPDGALYIADWSNPIIQHGEVDFRDPRRDHEHGRIWRVSHKGRPLAKKQNLLAVSNAELLENLNSPNGYLRQRSRRVLTERGDGIKGDVQSWTEKQTAEHAQLEALWMHQSLDQVNAELLNKVLAAKDGAIRAAAVRVLSFWHPRLDNPLELAARAVQDEHPRVRVEAVRAAAKIPNPRAAELVLSALEHPIDRFLDYAIWLSINDLAEPWVKAVASGDWKWEGREKQLEFALEAVEPRHASAVLNRVLAEKPIDREGTGPWIGLIAKAGSREHLAQLLDRVLADEFAPAAKIKALDALSEAARLRQISPAENREKVMSLFDSTDPALRAASIRLAGRWKLGGAAGDLLKIAGDKDSPAREPAFQSLREIGGEDVQKGLAALAGAGHDVAIRAEAVKALTAIDLARGTPLAVEVLSALPTEEAALNLWRALLGGKGAAAAFARAIPKYGLPETMVKAGLRAAREGGRTEPNLVLALARNIDAEDEAKNLSPEELKRLLAFIQEKGDPARGERVYRRQELACVTCHAIGGVGGKVGPDLTSIGASAPADYLVESMLFPNRKVKEGYHAVIVETADDQELSGVLVRETDEQLIIRDAANREVSVAKNNIRNQRVGGSIMPAGLIDILDEQEQADLYRFLSELGKPGEFDASKGNVARLWNIIPRTLDVAQFTDDKVVTAEKTGTISHNSWEPVMTLVNGRLGKAEMEAALARVKYRDPDALYLKTRFEVSKTGPVRFQFPELGNASIWIDGKPVPTKSELKVELPSGPHTLAMKLDAKSFPDYLLVSTPDATFIND
jgi:putative heme-binding domain-containing protein